MLMLTNRLYTFSHNGSANYVRLNFISSATDQVTIIVANGAV